MTADNERLLALGGSRGFAPLPGVGRVLLGETLIFQTDPRLGRVAHASIWRDDSLQVLLPEEPDEILRPRWRIRGLGFTTSGEWLLVTESELIQERLGSRTLPGAPRAFHAARDGSLYIAVEDKSRFALYRAHDFTSPWLPIAGATPVTAFFEGDSGPILAAGKRFGRAAGAGWRFSDWPAGFEAEEITADASGRRIMAWNHRAIHLSSDAGETFRACQTGDVTVSEAFFGGGQGMDPLVLDRRGQAFQLDEASCR